MPAQAVANGLELSPIPNQLFNLTDLERKLISLQIPFMKIMSLFRYGSHYKVDGPPVNVPTTLEKICKLLPRIPDEAQVYPMKLKRKLKYKGNYMYNTMRKDVVMNALVWLKHNNEHYRDIEINDFWVDYWENDELGMLIDANNDDEDSQVENNMCDDVTTNVSENETHQEYLNRKLDEKELREDQLAADRMAETNGQQDSCTLQLEHIEDGVYSVAPGEDNLPKYVLLDKDFEVLAFPDLFLFGEDGFHTVEKRDTPLSLRKYYKQRILNVDGCFAKNIEYLFCAQYAADLKQIQSDANVALCITKGRTIGGNCVNAGMLKNPQVLNNLVRTEQAYKFLKNMRGSPPFWQHQLYEVMAMLRALGIPTWFLTLSSADLHWPEMIQAVGI